MQNEKKGFTKREKVLLLLVTVLGITTVMVMYVIIPFFNQLQDQRELLDATSLERMQIEMIMATEYSLRQGHELASSEYYELREVFLTESHLSGIGLMLTRLIEEHNMHPIEQRLSNPVVEPERDMFMVVTASMTISGSYTNLKRLLDTVEEKQYLRISHYSFSTNMDGETSNVRINFEATMVRDV